MIKIDLSKDVLFDTLGMIRLKESYMKAEETSPQERFSYICSVFSNQDDKLAQRLYDYMSSHWLSPSSPQLSFGGSKQGLPISCFLAYLPDTTRGLIDTWAEVSELSVVGGGIGIGVGIRQADAKSTGVIAHLRTYDASCTAYKQGQTRRGSYAAYLNINHPEIYEFLNTRRVSGDPNYKLRNIHNGINITDDFMRRVEIISTFSKLKDVDEIAKKLKELDIQLQDRTLNTFLKYVDEWDLVDPHTNKTCKTVSVKELWQNILETRAETGEPYLHFIDTSQKALPESQKNMGLTVKQSNLCSEITLATDEKRTAVCCLASLNLDYYDQWSKNEQFYLDVATYLDNVLQYFIDHAPKTLQRAIYSATRERAIGIGALGFHSYLQAKHISLESMEAYHINNQIFKTISTNLKKVNLVLGSQRGEAPDCAGTGKRFSHMMAIAPNATSSIIMGNTSPSCEPFRANVYKQDTLSGSHITYNKHLKQLLETRVSNKAELQNIFQNIKGTNGSVQHLNILTNEEKKVFKCWDEIDQGVLIRLAAARQKYIDQSQSISLFFHPNATKSYVHSVHINAWKYGLKTLYYYRSSKILSVDKIGLDICTFCEG
jgi:ribonucleoside-diphosphate reductase alpha chain